MTTIYWTDDQFNRWSEADGVTSYAPPGPDSGGSLVALFSPDGAGGFFVFGVTADDGVTGQPALGWRTTDTLVETDGFWVPLDSSGQWTLPGGDTVTGYSGYDGTGAHYDAVTGRVFLTGIFWRDDLALGIQVEHYVLIIDPSVPAVVDSAVTGPVEPAGPGRSAAIGGQCVLGRKLYYLAGADAASIVEFDLDTHVHRLAQTCFQFGRQGDLKARPGDDTGLWIVDRQGWESPFDVLLRRFEVEDIPWGTSDTPAVPSESLALFRNDGTALPAANVNAFYFTSANQIAYQATSTGTNNLAFFRQTISPLGAPDLLVDLGASWGASHNEAYQMYALTSSAWPLHVVTADGTTYRVGPDSNPDGGLLRLVEADGTRWVQSASGAPMAVVGADGTVLTTLPMIAE